MYQLTITYEASEPDYAFEREVCKLLGTSEYDCGFGFGERDMEFFFKDYKSASLAKDMAEQIARLNVHGISKIEDDDEDKVVA